MTSPVVTVVTDEPAPEAPAVIPVILQDPAALAAAEELGALRMQVTQLQEQVRQAQVTAEVAQATAEVNGEIAEVALATSESAIEVAAVAIEEASTPEVEEVPVEAPKDESPVKQHWMFRELNEWRRK